MASAQSFTDEQDRPDVDAGSQAGQAPPAAPREDEGTEPGLHGDSIEGSRFSPPRQEPIDRPED